MYSANHQRHKSPNERVAGTVSIAGDLIRALRPHQWVKNLLVFFPVVAAHRLLDRGVIIPAVLGFVAFSLTASAAYVVNDLVDLPSDRRHRTKSQRPFASGALSRQWAFALVPLLLFGAIGIAIVLPARFQLILAMYWGLTTLYTVRIKRIALLDIVVLAGLYTIRLFGGGEATGVVLSNWLLAFSMFFFVSLAFVKRVAELLALTDTSQVLGREYSITDLAVLGRMGVSAGYTSVLVLALYINSVDVLRFYRHPERLWLLCGLLFFWLSRVWLITERHEMHDDPAVFALRDPGSYLIVGLSVIVLYWAT